MPPEPVPVLPLDMERAEELIQDHGHLYWSFPDDHPVRQHRGPGVMVLANPERHRAYVFTSGKEDAIKRAQQVMADIRKQANPRLKQPKFAPDGHMLRSKERNVPPLLARDWEEDGPEAFRWSLVQALPERFWNDPRFGQGGRRQKEYTHYLRGQIMNTVKGLKARGWDVYNPPMIRGLALPGAQMAYRERREQWDQERAEERRNHLDWRDQLAEGSIGLDPSVDPDDRDIQRAFARYQHGMGHPLPKEGGPMRGHKSSDHYVYQLPEGELTRNCPQNCPRRRPGQVDNALVP